MSAIDNAKKNLVAIREANAKAEADGLAAIESAVGETFVHGITVKTLDHAVTKKDGSTEEKEGSTYTVDLVRGENVLVVGKGGALKAFHYTKLEVVEA